MENPAQTPAPKKRSRPVVVTVLVLALLFVLLCVIGMLFLPAINAILTH